jgi:hypothetical protein
VLAEVLPAPVSVLGGEVLDEHPPVDPAQTNAQRAMRQNTFTR